MAPAGRPKPGRYLALVAGVLIALYVGLFLGPSPTPALGLDLRGGTQVTLTAHPLTPGGKISKSALNQAVDIIRQRTNGLGVGGADISTQGSNNIVVSVPGKGRDQVVNSVGQTALLRFRQVMESGASGVTPTPSTSASASTSPKKTRVTPRATLSTGSSSKRGKHSNGEALRSAFTRAAPSAKRPKATASATTTASPSGSPTATPGATATPAPSGSASSNAGTSAGTAPLPNSQAPTLTTALKSAYANLDCAKTPNPTGGEDNQNDYVLACGTGSSAGAKYLLGPAKVLGTDVSSASSSLSPNSISDWQVNLSFTGSGGGKWQELTAKAYQAQPASDGAPPTSSCGPPTGCNAVAIVLDGIVQSAPYISQAGGIPGGQAQITGSFTKSQADQLANVLKYGALPLKFETADVSSVSATLGASQLRGGLIAGIIGLGLVILFSLLYYRALGLVTVGSLLVSGLILYAVTTLLGHSSVGYTLSLPGIAGFIVAVGITADSFVVFFERLRDEIREGRRLRSGVERAWPRARRTIISADSVSLLAAVILYIVSIGDVRGFAFTLGLSTLSDLFIVFFFTKPLIQVLARIKAFDTARPWTGVGKARAGAVAEPEPSRVRRPREA